MNVLRFPVEKCTKTHLPEPATSKKKCDILFFPGVRYSILEKPSATRKKAKSSNRKS